MRHPVIQLALLSSAALAAGTPRAASGQSQLRQSRPRLAATAARVALGDVRVATGVRLRYAEQGDPAAAPVIMLHGYSDSWRSFGPMMSHLPGTVRAIALDLRGHGDSDRPAGGYAMRDLAADVLAFMDARGIARATVVGHSMGSFVAQQVALAAPSRVERMVLIGSATTPRNVVGMRDLKAAVDGFGAPDAPAPAAFAREFQQSSVHRPVAAAFMDEAVAASLRLPARVWRAAMDGMLATDPPAGLGAHRIPTLLLWGDRDPMMTRAEQGALVRMLGTATLRVYPGTGHTPQWEQPAEVARDLVAFVAPRPSP